ncbi:flagellar assembly protein T N-terminal domain-containing protein [Salinibius halmophilus]|uniref:flagellar assembly protein T N-terminal domain-containing protein n=1 Tax=Salinibius halmophilus TaxID=1853216 RepID=UPI0013148944|nr:flagellar assembly protein T N-terminal domain-containing protein [Salinibius halmophilus]
MRLLLLLTMMIALPVAALTVEATGEAEIHYGDVSAARYAAVRQAMAMAAEMGSVRVQSQSQWQSGEIVQFQIQTQTRAGVTTVAIVEEQVRANSVWVKIEAEVTPEAVCRYPSNGLRRSVVVAGFDLIDNAGARLGKLEQVPTRTAQYIAQQLQQSSQHLVLDASYMSAQPMPQSAPTYINERDQLTNAVAQSTRELGGQYILSGVVVSLSSGGEVGPVTRVNQLQQQLGMGSTNRGRQFAMKVFLHDAQSGALVNQWLIDIEADWRVPRTQSTGYLTPAFARTDYGQAVNNVLADVAESVAEQLSCQPFMANISHVDGNKIMFEVSSTSGVRPGDMLAVLRKTEAFNRQGQATWQLTDTKIMATVTKVQPYLVVAELPVQGHQLNLQVDDVLVAW